MRLTFLLRLFFRIICIGIGLFLIMLMSFSKSAHLSNMFERDIMIDPHTTRYSMTSETGTDLQQTTQHTVDKTNPYCVLHSEETNQHSVEKTNPYCMLHSEWYRRYPSKRVTTNFSSWTYNDKSICLVLNISNLDFAESNLKFSFTCTKDKKAVFFTTSKFKRTISNNDVLKVSFGDQCLKRYIDSCCTDDLPVPNVVHYVRYGKGELGFFEFVSFISVIRFVRPCAILIHGDILPNGTYWNYVLALSPNIIHVYRKPPGVIFGQKRGFKTHASDIMRIEALLEYGGIYIDTDTVFVNSVEMLRKYPYTMSQQKKYVVSSAFIMAEKNATFLNRWLDGYKYHYENNHYTYNAMIYPSYLALNFSSLINNVYGQLSRPISQLGAKVYTQNSEWTGIYGMHLYTHIFKETMTINKIRRFNSTVGSITRHILFGNKELCHRKSAKSDD